MKWASQSSTVNSVEEPYGNEAALFTRMSTPPNCFTVSATIRFTSSVEVMSAEMATTLPPVASAISFAACSRRSRRRATITTLTPCPARAVAQALPIPTLPPVTMAVLPLMP